MVIVLGIIYLFGAVTFFLNYVMGGKESDETAIHLVVLGFIAAVGWPLWFVCLIVAMAYWAVVGD